MPPHAETLKRSAGSLIGSEHRDRMRIGAWVEKTLTLGMMHDISRLHTNGVDEHERSNLDEHLSRLISFKNRHGINVSDKSMERAKGIKTYL